MQPTVSFTSPSIEDCTSAPIPAKFISIFTEPWLQPLPPFILAQAFAVAGKKTCGLEILP